MHVGEICRCNETVSLSSSSPSSTKIAANTKMSASFPYNFAVYVYTNLPRISIFFLFFDFLTAITSDCELARVRLRCRLRQPRCIDADDCELATVRLRRRHQSNAVRYVHNLMNDEQIVNHNKPRPAHHYIILAKSTSVTGEPTSTARSLTSVPDGLGSSQHLMIIIGINGLTCREIRAEHLFSSIQS